MATLVIVTGGSSGLGRAVLDGAPAGAARLDVSRTGHPDPEVAHVAADLADPNSWAPVGERLTDEIRARDWERITFVHNAGTLEPIGFAGEHDAHTVTTNVLLNSAAGQVLGHHFLSAVRGLTGRRELVLISSGAGRRAVPGWSNYGAAKAAHDHWARIVAAEQARRGGTRVISVAPGVIDTAMQERIRHVAPHDFPDVQRFHELHAQGELRAPQDVAEDLWRLLDRPAGPDPVVDLRG